MGKKACKRCKSPESILVSAKFAFLQLLLNVTPHRQTPHLIWTEDFVGTLPCFFYLMMTAIMIMLVIITEGIFFPTSLRTLTRCPMSKWELSSIFTINLEVCNRTLSDNNWSEVKGQRLTHLVVRSDLLLAQCKPSITLYVVIL